MDNSNMTDDQMIADLVAQLDSGFSKGVGHVNVDVDDTASQGRQTQTMGCADCSRTPLACSVPTLQEGMDRSFKDYQ